LQGEQEEQHAQHILALGGPGNGFNIDRVQRKQRAHYQAGPGDSGRLAQQKKKEYSISRVQQKICVVTTSGIKAKDLAVQGMR